MNAKPTPDFQEVIIIEPDVYRDNRGRFLETYQAARYSSQGISRRFVQDNVSYSGKGVVRGLHYQVGRPQGKLVWVAQGEVWDIAVDIRRDSPTFGKWASARLSAANHRQIYVPEGFAHGFCVLSDTAVVVYKCTDYYVPEADRGILWNDPSLGIEWPVGNPVVSDKDSRLPLLEAIGRHELPAYKSNHSYQN